MNNEKEYYDKNLERILRSKITREKYGDFALILEEIFQRRAYEFDFLLEQMEQEVENFVRNVNSIEFVSKEEMNGSPNAMGIYCPGEFTIKLNESHFYNKFKNDLDNNQLGIEVFETLTHEVYHAISDYSKDGYLGLSYKDGQKWKGNALNEIFTETAADRASYGKKVEEADNYRNQTSGYTDITFVTNLLAASIGVSEKEVLKAGVQNRGTLSELFYSKFPNFNEADFAKNDLFDPIETDLDIIYNASYNPNSDYITYDMRKNLVKSSLIALYNNIYELASFQIAVDVSKELSDSAADATYRFLKMEKIMKDSLKYFKKIEVIDKNDIKEIEKYTHNSRNTMAIKVNGLNNLNDEKFKINDPTILQEQFERVKRNEFYKESNINMLKNNYGFNLVYKNIKEIQDDTKDLKYTNYILKEDYDNGLQWDNTSASIVTKKIFDKRLQEMLKIGAEKTQELPIITDDMLEKKEESFLSKIKNGFKNIIKKFQNRNLKQLPEPEKLINIPESNSINTHEAWVNQYKVSKEELIPMEEVLKQNEEKSKNRSTGEKIQE